MNKLILICILFSSSICYSQSNKISIADSILITKIKNAKPRNFIGKTLNEYLLNDSLKKYKEWIPSTEPHGKLYSILLSYSKRIWVEIIFTDILYQKKFSEKFKWNFDLLKKEKIAEIKYSW
jgi:hypothetical protein